MNRKYLDLLIKIMSFSLIEQVKRTHIPIAKFTYFSITAMAVVFYFAGRASAEISPIANTFQQLTINSMAPANESIRVAIPTQAQAMFGGLTQVSCPVGTSPARCMPMGFLNTAFGVGQLTPQSAAIAAGKSALTGNETLAVATPWLGRISVKDAMAGNPSLAAILPASAYSPATLFGGRTINPSIQNLPFGNVVNLSSTLLNRVPSLAATPFNNFAGIQRLTAAMIPNIGNIPLANMPTMRIPAGMAVIKMDLIRNQERNINHMVMSGSEQQPNAPCQSNCDYVETRPVVGMPYLKGAKIISGDSLQVRGGKGLLAWVNGGKEPTGIHFAGMKLVVRNVNAKKGTAMVNLNFRACFYAFGEHCTPYFIGFPLWQLSERRNSFPLITTDASVSRIMRGRP